MVTKGTVVDWQEQRRLRPSIWTITKSGLSCAAKLYRSASWARTDGAKGEKWNDLFLWCDRKNTCGSFSISGEVAFFQGASVASDPNWQPGIKIVHPLTTEELCKKDINELLADPWIALSHMKSAPKGWQDADPKVKHSMTRDWNCCCEPVPKGCPKTGGDPVCVPKLSDD